jgi:PelA/Pel-15E family pectate lyase
VKIGSRWVGAVSVCTISIALSVGASVVGTNPPAESLTRERVVTLPRGERRAWLQYIEQSIKQRQADKDAFHAEMKHAGVIVPIEPPHSYGARSIPLNRPQAWYASAEARHIADVIVSFQTPAGGWGKNTDMSKGLRAPGEIYAANNLSRFPLPDDFDTPREPDWNYVGTIDNDATITQIQFLAKAISAGGGEHEAAYRAAFLHGIEYLFAAQNPNGGWPQVWPLEGGYHDAITLNDDAMTQVMELMHHLADGQHEYGVVPETIRKRAARSFARGIRCILAAQIVSDGKRTVWAQQHDALTLKPVSGRNFEPSAESSSESAQVLMLLMDSLPKPNAEEQDAIRAAAAWFKKTAIYEQSWKRLPEGGQLVAKPGAGPIWARYYQIGTESPIFTDRDKTIHDNVSELSKERRNGYAWYNTAPLVALKRFEEWNKEHPEKK